MNILKKSLSLDQRRQRGWKRDSESTKNTGKLRPLRRRKHRNVETREKQIVKRNLFCDSRFCFNGRRSTGLGHLFSGCVQFRSPRILYLEAKTLMRNKFKLTNELRRCCFCGTGDACIRIATVRITVYPRSRCCSIRRCP